MPISLVESGTWVEGDEWEPPRPPSMSDFMWNQSFQIVEDWIFNGDSDVRFIRRLFDLFKEERRNEHGSCYAIELTPELEASAYGLFRSWEASPEMKSTHISYQLFYLFTGASRGI